MEQRTDYISVSETIFYIILIQYEGGLHFYQRAFDDDYEATQIAQKNGMCLLLIHPEDEKRLIGQCIEDEITLMVCTSIEIYQNKQWYIKGFTMRCDPSGNLLTNYHEGKWEVGATSIISTVY